MIYLYKKTHKVTGLKYLGKTTRDPFSYMGSGVYWRRHLKKHGNDVDTEILYETIDKEEFKQKGLYYTKLWNVVESDEWANLKPETGDGGSGIMTNESKEKIRRYQKNNKVWTKKALENLKNIAIKSATNRKGSKWTNEHRHSRTTSYIAKNLDIATKVIALADQGLNRRQISLELNITWDKVKYLLLNRSEFEKKIKEI